MLKQILIEQIIRINFYEIPIIRTLAQSGFTKVFYDFQLWE